MQNLLNRRDFLATSSAGLTAAGVSLFSFPLVSGAQGNRSARVPRGTYVRAEADMDLLFLSGTTALDLYHLHPHVPYEMLMPEDIPPASRGRAARPAPDATPHRRTGC